MGLLYYFHTILLCFGFHRYHLPIFHKGVIAVDEKEEKHEIPAESVVFSPGFSPDRSLAIELEKQGLEICTAGDCVAPRKVVDAVREGFLAGFNL